MGDDNGIVKLAYASNISDIMDKFNCIHVVVGRRLLWGQQFFNAVVGTLILLLGYICLHRIVSDTRLMRPLMNRKRLLNWTSDLLIDGRRCSLLLWKFCHVFVEFGTRWIRNFFCCVWCCFYFNFPMQKRLIYWYTDEYKSNPYKWRAFSTFASS